MKSRQRMSALGWLLTYALPVAIMAFGSVTQGDDDAWRASMFIVAPIAALGIGILWIGRAHNRRFRWMSVIHVLTVILAIRILPGYWTRVTVGHDHIGAGFDREYVGAFQPEAWHLWWAPIMTSLSLAVAFLAIDAFTKTQAGQAAP